MPVNSPARLSLGAVGVVAKKYWLFIVVVLVLGIAGLFVNTFRQRDLHDASIVHSPPGVAMGAPAETTIDYTVNGPDGADATLAYLDPEGPVQRASVSLPWSVSLRTHHLSPAASLMVYSSAESLSCAISVNGTVLVERQSLEASAPFDCTLSAT